MELEASVTTKIDMDPCFFSVNFRLIFLQCVWYSHKNTHIYTKSLQISLMLMKIGLKNNFIISTNILNLEEKTRLHMGD